MKQYIDKDALVAEIERLIDEIYAGQPFDSLSSGQQTALWYVKSIMSSINTLEMKEVDSTNIFIEKACKWLSNVSIEDMDYKYNNFDTSEGWDKFIKDFRNYMKGE